MKQMIFYMMMALIMLILVMINVLISVAFLTLLERKFLALIQLRQGPNKVGYMGILQPFSDAIKLLLKENNFMYKSNFLLYIYSPIFMLVLNLMMWMIYPFWTNLISFKYGFIYLMCCFSLGVYGLMMSGWCSNSMYSMLGSIRSLAQSISYEVVLSLMLLIPMSLSNSFNLLELLLIQTNLEWLMVFFWPLSMIFLLSLLAELNRSPFDFSEGESELVSGFNIEYGSVGFVMIFLSEYMSILFLSYLYCIFYWGSNFFELYFYLKVVIMIFTIIWLRACMPRFRYDLLMYLCWVMILPISLNYLCFMIYMKLYI